MIVSLGLLAVASAGPVVDRVAAVINDDVIALSEIYDIGRSFIEERCPDSADPCVTEAELEVLDALIRRSLVRQELARLKLEVTAQDVDQAIDRTARQYGLPDRAALKTEIEATGKRWDQYREELFEYLRTQNFQGHVLAPRITITDDEVRDLYQRTARKVSKPVVRLSGFGIGIPPESTPEAAATLRAKADEVVGQLNRGELPWDEAVKLYDGGGRDLFTGRLFEPGMLVEPLEGVIFNAPVGEVQPPVPVLWSGGVTVLFILRVDEKSERSEVAPLEQIEEELKNQLFQQKLLDAEEEWYQRARREAAIDVKLKVG